MAKKVYQVIASSFNAYKHCIKAGNETWKEKHREAIDRAISKFLPSGSGLDLGIKLDHVKSTDEKLVFYSAYHVMNENGYYEGWIEFTCTVSASLVHEVNIALKGRFSDYREQGEDIREYLGDTLDYALTADVSDEEEKALYAE